MKRRLLRFLFASLLILLLIGGMVVLPAVRELRQEEKNRALITAVKVNDASAVVRLLNEGADANARDIQKEDRSFWRVVWDRLRGRTQKKKNTAPTALLLLISVQREDSQVSLPPENVSLARALLEHSADPNTFMDGWVPPLEFALLLRRPETALLLVQHGANLKPYAFLPCTGTKGMDADVYPCNPNMHYNPLFVAAVSNHTDTRVLQAMLDRGADINEQDRYYCTPLRYAISRQDVSTVRFLLGHHADLTIKGHKGDTILSYAVYWAKVNPSPKVTQIVRMLRQAGAR